MRKPVEADAARVAAVFKAADLDAGKNAMLWRELCNLLEGLRREWSAEAYGNCYATLESVRNSIEAEMEGLAP